MIKLRALLSVLAISLILLPAASAQEKSDVEGYWKSIDEDTGKASAYWQFVVKDGILEGYVLTSPTLEPGAKCDKCKGEFKDKPILGTPWLQLKKRTKDGVWEKGYIIDTRNGKQYKANVSVENGKLKVRGYIGFSLIGKTQYWEKATKEEAEKGF